MLFISINLPFGGCQPTARGRGGQAEQNQSRAADAVCRATPPFCRRPVFKVGRGELYPTIQVRVKQGGCHCGKRARQKNKPPEMNKLTESPEYRQALFWGPDSESWIACDPKSWRRAPGGFPAI